MKAFSDLGSCCFGVLSFHDKPTVNTTILHVPECLTPCHARLFVSTVGPFKRVTYVEDSGVWGSSSGQGIGI